MAPQLVHCACVGCALPDANEALGVLLPAGSPSGLLLRSGLMAVKAIERQCCGDRDLLAWEDHRHRPVRRRSNVASSPL